YQGGLYPGGSNVRPAAHTAAGLARGRAIVPVDARGAPDPNGKYGLVTIGVSITAGETKALIPVAEAHPEKDPHLVIVNGASAMADAEQVADPTNDYWPALDGFVADAGLSPRQVRLVWIKTTIGSPSTQTLPQNPQELRGYLVEILHTLMEHFPRLSVAYVSTRTYAGYSTTKLNPEPFAYWTGFAVKWLVEGQLNGDPALNFDPARGPVKAPWLSWGPYFWADGLNPRSDGLIWRCEDFHPDGTHVSPLGRAKNVDALMAFFMTDTTAVPWFIDDEAPQRRGWSPA
nr:hypothetical protein [Actinomycetota bacterium]